MAAEDLQLGRINTLTQALERIPQGRDAYELSRRLGLVTPEYAHPEERDRFPAKFSELSPDQLSDLNAYWLSESGRLTELVGSLAGHLKLLGLQEKAARAAARSRARANVEEGARKPTQSELNDLAEEDESVIDLIEKLAYIELLHAQVKATLDATRKYLDGIDKEIILRTSQMKARLLG